AAGRVRGDLGADLVSRRVGVHLELAAARRTGAVETLAEDAGVVSVATGVGVVRWIAGPDDDEVSCGSNRDRRRPLCSRGGRVGALLAAARRADSREALHED